MLVRVATGFVGERAPCFPLSTCSCWSSAVDIQAIALECTSYGGSLRAAA